MRHRIIHFVRVERDVATAWRVVHRKSRSVVLHAARVRPETGVAVAIFVGYPWLAAVIGLLLAALYAAVPSRTLLVAAAVWILYAVYEELMHRRVLCSGECNIRVDLLLIYPMLLVLTAAALFRFWRRRRPGD